MTLKTPVFAKGKLKVDTLDPARCNACNELRMSMVLTGPNGHVTFCARCGDELTKRCEEIGSQVKTTVQTAIKRAIGPRS
jgi:hypothetical protein